MRDTLSIQADVSLQKLNTFGIDAKARAFLAVRSVDDLRAVVADEALCAMPRLVLGGGSNLLLTRDFPGLVLHMCMTGKSVSDEDDAAIYVTAAAGENWHDFVRWTIGNGWGGLENLSLIPGTVGAAPVQNIGAYGAELREYFHSLQAFDFHTGDVRTFNREDCRFAYRDSVFRQAEPGRFAILSVTFALPRQWRPNLAWPELAATLPDATDPALTPKAVSDAIIAIRQRKLPDPAQIGNAGSFFKNPTVTAAVFEKLKAAWPTMPGYAQPDGNWRIAAGWLIEQCGWKGKNVGDAGVCETQALVLVNRGLASGAEIISLSQRIQEDVKARFGLWLEPEPVFV
ncbi:MAG: UDP-N-acetylmuramate dehydrogenase [Burkholderiaceae bacterium]|jgi:UDP-N-acetylmuramate dehydrogenase|nr:UDP-N-acetylmuramate dehydrogenase [Burkholderiaceae bacterium]